MWCFNSLSCTINLGVKSSYRFERSTVTRSGSDRNKQKVIKKLHKMTVKHTDCIWIGIGIDIAPSDSVFSQLTKLNSQLNQEFGSPYNLKLNPLHINLYDLDISEDNLEKADVILREVTRKSSTFSIKLGKVSFFEHGSIFVACEPNEPLKTFEREIVEAIVPFKGTCRTEEYWEPWRQYTEQQKIYREQYGNPHVLDAFTPHITVGYVKKEKTELEKITNQLSEKFEASEFTVKQISMAIQNSEGKIVERKIYNLSN